MINLKHLFLPALALAFALPAGAVRAKVDPVTVTQPDGSTLTLRAIGDERAHFLLASDGALVTEENGTYYFARLQEDGKVVSTNIPAADPGKRSSLQIGAIQIPTQHQITDATVKRMAMKPRSYDLSESRKSAAMARARGTQNGLPQYGLGRCKSAFPNKGDVKALVILVEYKDVKMRRESGEYFRNMLNQEGFSDYYGTGSAADYFRYNSNGLFNPQFDVYGPVTLPNIRSYYGKNDQWGEDSNATGMVIDALEILDPDVDFSQYDMDGDGRIDNVFVFFAGDGEHRTMQTDLIWPHAYHLDGTGYEVDGVRAYSYGCTSEIAGSRPDGVGTFIHEFSHVLGLPDLYDTATDLMCNPFAWSCLDYGPYNNDGCTPPNYSAYELNAMGWIEPELLDGPDEVTLEHITDSRKCKLIQTDNPNEFFLIENRQQVNWDRFIPNHGMLVWHIDWDENIFEKNVVNNDKNHLYVRMLKPNNVDDCDFRDDWDAGVKIAAGWCYPGTSGKTELTSSTTPALKSWSNKGIELPITEITEKDGVISFIVDGGLGKFGRAVALQPEEDEIGEDWFIAKWEAVEAATDYLLTVYEKDKGVWGFDETANMGKETVLALPTGWDASTTAVYNTNGNFGEAAPSLRLNSNGGYLKTDVFEADINETELWLKGNGAEGSTLDVTGIRLDGSEVFVESLVPSETGAIVAVKDIPAGVRQLVFTFNKVKGNIAVDDVKIICYGAQVAVLDGYNDIKTNGATQMRIENLNPEKEYMYSVLPIDGEETAKVRSNTITVVLPTSGTSVETVKATALSVTGRHLIASDPVSIYALSGTALAHGVTDHTFDAPGLYISRTADKAHQLIIK